MSTQAATPELTTLETLLVAVPDEEVVGYFLVENETVTWIAGAL